MKKSRVFNSGLSIAKARAGELTGVELRRAINVAEEFGNKNAADELKKYIIAPEGFAGDAAPMEIRNRVAQGISALVAMGEPLSRTRQMLKRHGVIETINRIAKYPNATKNFDRLCAAGLSHLTAEAIVLDYPHLFSEEAARVARRRLGLSER